MFQAIKAVKQEAIIPRKKLQLNIYAIIDLPLIRRKYNILHIQDLTYIFFITTE